MNQLINISPISETIIWRKSSRQISKIEEPQVCIEKSGILIIETKKRRVS
jgi:hypothetical protein